MSIQAVAWVLENSQSKGTARLVLIALANRANPDHNWECWPAMRGLAREAGVSSPETVRTAIRGLSELGEIKVVSTGDHRHPGRYQLTFMGVQNMDTGVQEMDTASSPDKTQRPVQGGQNRNEPELNRRRPPTALESFELTDERKSWAKSNTPDIDLRLHTQRFVNHFKGEATKKRDWERTWKNWMLKEQDRVPNWVRNRPRAS